VELLMQGLTRKEIANRINPNTMETFLQLVMRITLKLLAQRYQ